jgi:hypothetical protein
LHIPVKKTICSGNKKPLPELSVSPQPSYRGGFFASTNRYIDSPPVLFLRSP